MVSRLGADLAIVFTLALLEGEINMTACIKLVSSTMCRAKETHRLATLNILDVLKKTEQEPLNYGIQTGIEGDGDPFSITVEDFWVSFKISLLIFEEGS